MTIRRATPADAQAIAAVLLRLAEETGDVPMFPFGAVGGLATRSEPERDA